VPKPLDDDDAAAACLPTATHTHTITTRYNVHNCHTIGKELQLTTLDAPQFTLNSFLNWTCATKAYERSRVKLSDAIKVAQTFVMSPCRDVEVIKSSNIR